MPDHHDHFYSESSDAEGSTSSSLLERARAHDPSAWRRLADLYGPLIYRWCRHVGLQPDDAADVVQEVFRSVAGHLERFRKEQPGDSFRGWLWTIARNKIRDHFRARKDRPQAAGGTDAHRQMMNWAAPDDPSASASSKSPLGRTPLQLALEAIRGDFGENAWKAFWMTTVEQHSSQDVARELGMTANAVRLAKSRILKRLRQELGGERNG
jgi:RNA polymerase sigma-70 factor, ECF subfamily